jgi:hypothetical protein
LLSSVPLGVFPLRQSRPTLELACLEELEPKFPTIHDAINQLKLRSTILDGEIVALDKDGVPRFQLLQRWQKRPTAPVDLCLFDLLWSGETAHHEFLLRASLNLQPIL